MEAILDIFRPVYPVSNDIRAAISMRHRDFEDCLLAMIAEREHCDILLTRNVKDFEGCSFKAVEPAEFVKLAL